MNNKEKNNQKNPLNPPSTSSADKLEKGEDICDIELLAPAGLPRQIYQNKLKLDNEQ
jgi:hypothetical protein